VGLALLGQGLVWEGKGRVVVWGWNRGVVVRGILREFLRAPLGFGIETKESAGTPLDPRKLAAAGGGERVEVPVCSATVRFRFPSVCQRSERERRVGGGRSQVQ
jgi:hypothetical protein